LGGVSEMERMQQNRPIEGDPAEPKFSLAGSPTEEEKLRSNSFYSERFHCYLEKNF